MKCELANKFVTIAATSLRETRWTGMKLQRGIIDGIGTIEARTLEDV
jgi:hypothetical protein